MVTYNNGSLRVSQTPLTITGSTTYNEYNGLIQTNTISSLSKGALKGTDTIESIQGLATGVNVTSLPYKDHLSGATGVGLSNYAITYINGSLSITQPQPQPQPQPILQISTKKTSTIPATNYSFSFHTVEFICFEEQIKYLSEEAIKTETAQQLMLLDSIKNQENKFALQNSVDYLYQDLLKVTESTIFNTSLCSSKLPKSKFHIFARSIIKE